MTPAKAAGATAATFAAAAVVAWTYDRWPASTYLAAAALGVYLKFRAMETSGELVELSGNPA